MVQSDDKFENSEQFSREAHLLEYKCFHAKLTNSMRRKLLGEARGLKLVDLVSHVEDCTNELRVQFELRC